MYSPNGPVPPNLQSTANRTTLRRALTLHSTIGLSLSDSAILPSSLGRRHCALFRPLVPQALLATHSFRVRERGRLGYGGYQLVQNLRPPGIEAVSGLPRTSCSAGALVLPSP